MKSNDTFLQTLNGIASAYGLPFGLAAYVAPNEIFGPNGLAPLFLKTSMDSNDLDPITEHYLRLGGAVLTGLTLSQFLFMRGASENEVRTKAKVGLCYFLLASPICVYHKLLDVDGWFVKEPAAAILASYILFALLYTNALRKASTLTAQAPESTEKQHALLLANCFSALYGGLHALKLYIYGPSRMHIAKTPLENDEFDPIMCYAARWLGALLCIAFVTFLDRHQSPVLLNKMSCLFAILITSLHLEDAPDKTGYMNTFSFSTMVAFDVLNMIIQFNAAGAFDRKAQAKSVPVTKKVG